MKNAITEPQGNFKQKDYFQLQWDYDMRFISKNDNSFSSLLLGEYFRKSKYCNQCSDLSTMEFVITGRNEVVAKVIFLHLSVILFTGGRVWGRHPRPPLPRSRHPPGAEPPGADTQWVRHPPPPGSRLQHTVNERPLRILLECILVTKLFLFNVQGLIKILMM